MMKFFAAASIAALALAACDRPGTVDPGEAPPPVDDTETPTDETPDVVQPGDEPPPEDDVLVDDNGRIFSYHPAGNLIPGSFPPSILVDTTVYDSNIVFPAEGPVYLNSQVYMHGGSQAALNGKGTNQCNAENYDYPWRDNFCEKRGRDQYFCAQGGHTGVDIRPASCVKETHWAVAPEAGEIYDIGSYGVRLMADDGTWYQFLHLQMNDLAVVEGQEVVPGQRIGKFSNIFFDSNGDPVPTTIHLHLDMKESYAPTNGEEPFIDRVNPYMTLVKAYERKLAAEQ
jgi:hypothetical protein